MKIVKRILAALLGILLILSVTVGALWLYLPNARFGFAYDCSDEEQALRLELITQANAHLGANEGTDAHRAIIDTYNAHEPLAQEYEVQYTDDWCAAFVSYIAIEQDLTDIIPTECGCERQIGLWQSIGRWEERDTYLPLPGDIIYYDWDVRTPGDSTGWSDHVGIVAGTHGPFIKVIEGNKDDAVACRYILRWDPRIRGYGLPDYAQKQACGKPTGLFFTADF